MKRSLTSLENSFENFLTSCAQGRISKASFHAQCKIIRAQIKAAERLALDTPAFEGSAIDAAIVLGHNFDTPSHKPHLSLVPSDGAKILAFRPLNKTAEPTPTPDSVA